MNDCSPADVNQLLARIGRGEELATAELLPVLYDELRALASRCFRGRLQGQTLQPTALVHEAFLKLAGSAQADWESRAHFLAVAAMAMRQILANDAESRRTQKRGGGRPRVTLSGLQTPVDVRSEVDLVDLDDALARLAELSPRQARIVEMRFLTGLTEDEIGHVLGVSTRTVQREWRMARAFLGAELRGDELISPWFTVGYSSPTCPRNAGHFVVFMVEVDMLPSEVEEHWALPTWNSTFVFADRFLQEWDGTEWGRVGTFGILRARHDPIPRSGLESWALLCGEWPDFDAPQWSFAIGDQDADAGDEVNVCGSDGEYLGNPPVFWDRLKAYEHDGRFGINDTWGERLSTFSTPPRLLQADWDGDDFRVRYTGDSELALGNPLPIVLMAAPPCKSGVSQNYSASGTTFETSSGTESVYAVTNGIAASVWAGYEVSDPLGIFRASGKLKLGVELERTDTEAVAVTFSENFTTAFDEDVIVFQGTLYESYEYEVVSARDVSAIGSIMTIDVPVATRVYKWTLDFYNATIDPEHAIAPEVLGNTVGDPASYMSRDDAERLVRDDAAHVPGEGYVGWVCDAKSLGQGGGSKGVTIELATRTSSAARLGWSVTAEQEVKVGGFVGGYSVGILHDSVYEVAVSRTTRYHGEVGDISDWSQYQTWNYDFGLVAFTRGLYSDADNQPDGTEDGVIPFQVVNYYANPMGSGYSAGAGQ